MKYIEYQEYLALGGTLELIAFVRYGNRAFSIIDSETKNRVAGMEAIPDKVKYLAVELIEYFAKTAKADAENVASYSQSAGNVSESVSYVSAKTNDEQLSDIDRLVTDYLSGVKDDDGVLLLYRGCENAS